MQAPYSPPPRQPNPRRAPAPHAPHGPHGPYAPVPYAAPQGVPQMAPHAAPPYTVPPHTMPPTGARQRPAWLPWLLLGGVGIGGVSLVLILVAFALWMYGPSSDPVIADGVAVAGLSVGGQTLDEAEAALATQNFGAQTVTFTDGDRSWSLSYATLGIGVDMDATLAQADDAPAGSTLQPVYTVDLSRTQTALIALSEQTNIDAVPGDPPQQGRALDIPNLLNRLYLDLPGTLAGGTIALPMIVTDPPEYDPVQHYTGEKTVHVVEKGQELGLIAKMYNVDMNDIIALNEISDADFIYPGQELLIPAAGEYVPSAEDAPAAPTASGKSIVVDTVNQRIYAYENGQLVHTHIVSTGRAETPTVKGDYKVYVKYEADDMSGPDYFLPQVPYTMYFYQGYAIHGTYWHNSFGRPMSHGCVNLPTDEAQWFFNWAQVGTPVRVI